MQVLQILKSKKRSSLHPVDFDQDLFVPALYNRTYYSQVMDDELALLDWQTGELKKIISAHLFKSGKGHYNTLLDIGCGPAIHHMLSLGIYANTIRLSDYMPENLAEIKRWQRRHPRSHDWRTFTRATLEREGVELTSTNIRSRQNEIRSKIKAMYILDLKQPIEDYLVGSADFVSCFFVSDSATKSKNVFEKMSKNAFKIVEPGGIFVGAFLGGCTKYRVGKKWINSADVTKSDIEQVFTKVGAKNVKIWKFDTPNMKGEGFDHIFAAVAEKPAKG